MLTWLLLAAMAHATDYEQAAKASMNLDFDWEAVEAQLDRAQAPAPSASETPAPYWPALPALPLEPNSKLDTVTVFRDRALVTRTLDAKVQKGSNTVTFEGLPLGIRSDALQASVVSGSARIVGVTLVSGTSPEDERERRDAITAQMRPLLDELGDVQDRIESLLTQRDYLRSTLLAPPSGDRPQPGVAEVRGMLTFLGDAERDLASRIPCSSSWGTRSRPGNRCRSTSRPPLRVRSRWGCATRWTGRAGGRRTTRASTSKMAGSP
jgi:hypothetical protein